MAKQNATVTEHRFLRALKRQAVDRTPVWMMRQAGRYLPEYRAVRQKAGGFLAMSHHPEIAAEITLQPLARFDLDAAILFSDILVLPDAMGLGLYFSEGEGPRFKHPVRDLASIKQLKIPDMEKDLGFVLQAIHYIQQSLAGKTPLIGFAGSPWTVAAYMVEGSGGSKNAFAKAQALLYAQPEAMLALLDKLVRATADYLNAQIAAGVDAVMLFDSWGGLLSTEAYQVFSLDPMQQVIARLNTQRDGVEIPVILFTKGGARLLNAQAQSGANAIGLDWTVSLGEVKAAVGHQVALQGNLNPAILLTDPETITREVARVLADFGQVGAGQGHIFNLGHGITPDVPVENVAAMIEAVKTLSPAYHQ